MSLERACVNCERCFALVNKVRDDLSAQMRSKNFEKISEEVKHKKYDLTCYTEKLGREREGTIEYEDLVETIDKINTECNYLFKSAEVNPELRERSVAHETYHNDQVYAARNEAMKALEAVFPLKDQGYLQHSETAEDVGVNIVALHALKACRSCDYSAPKIVETIHGKDYSSKRQNQ